jgi:serine/threonine-protein kinase
MTGRTFLGRYETIRLLGEGGMGKVYLAKQTDLGRQVVVKVMHEHVAADHKFRERFQRETLLMARFQHPYVVALYDASLNDPQGPCIVMEYIRGITLDTLMHRNGRLSPPRAARLLEQLCEALTAAHTEGIIHRDLKPANLMVVDPDTPYEKIKVMDFGLAKLMDHSQGLGMMHRQTQTGLDFAVGTPGYISPEQVRGEEVDFRSDIYSVGVILFELLTGKLPFSRDDTMDVLFAHATESPPGFADVGAGDWVPAEVEQVVMKCLAKTPADRPSSARELADRFNEAVLHAARRGEADRLDEEPAERSQEPQPEPPRTEVLCQPTVLPYDPNLVVHQLEAWMPDAIATYKLRGFVHDIKGEVLESVPGMIRMRIGNPDSKGAFSWFGLGKKVPIVDVELRLERTNPKQISLLHILVLMSSPERKGSANPQWRERCGEIFCELRSYLAGAVVTS